MNDAELRKELDHIRATWERGAGGDFHGLLFVAEQLMIQVESDQTKQETSMCQYDAEAPKRCLEPVEGGTEYCRFHAPETDDSRRDEKRRCSYCDHYAVTGSWECEICGRHGADVPVSAGEGQTHDPDCTCIDRMDSGLPFVRHDWICSCGFRAEQGRADD